MDFSLHHLIFPLQLQNLLLFGSVFNIIFQLQRLVPLQLAFLFHLVQTMLQLVNLEQPESSEKRKEIIPSSDIYCSENTSLPGENILTGGRNSLCEC